MKPPRMWTKNEIKVRKDTFQLIMRDIFKMPPTQRAEKLRTILPIASIKNDDEVKEALINDALERVFDIGI